MFHSFAKINIIQNPKKIKQNTDFLITAIADEELCRYYRYWVKKCLYLTLFRPSWHSHITVSKLNSIEKFETVKKFNKKKIKFFYEPIVRYAGDTTNDKPPIHWFIDVYSDDIREIRQTLDLPDYTKFHITIGIDNRFL